MVPLKARGVKKSKHVDVELSTRKVPLAEPLEFVCSGPPIRNVSGPVETAVIPNWPFVVGGGVKATGAVVMEPPHPRAKSGSTEDKRYTQNFIFGPSRVDDTPRLNCRNMNPLQP